MGGPHRRCPAAMLVNTVASGSSRDVVRAGPPPRRCGPATSAQCIESWPFQRGGPAAQDGSQAHVQVGRVPDQQHAPSLWADIEHGGARQTHGCADRWGRRCGGRLVGQAHGRVLSQSNSVTALPASCALLSYLVAGRTTEIGRLSADIQPGQPWFGVADLGDLLRVARVVGGGVQHPAGVQPVSDQRHRAGLQQPALVVTGLGPRIGEEHPDTTQRAGRDQLFQHVDGIAADQPDIGDVFPVDGRRAAAPARADTPRRRSRRRPARIAPSRASKCLCHSRFQVQAGRRGQTRHGCPAVRRQPRSRGVARRRNQAPATVAPRSAAGRATTLNAASGSWWSGGGSRRDRGRQAGWGRRRRCGRFHPGLRTHPFIVTYESIMSPPVGQIDTQQLPSAGTR